MPALRLLRCRKRSSGEFPWDASSTHSQTRKLVPGLEFSIWHPAAIPPMQVRHWPSSLAAETTVLLAPSVRAPHSRPLFPVSSIRSWLRALDYLVRQSSDPSPSGRQLTVGLLPRSVLIWSYRGRR